MRVVVAGGGIGGLAAAIAIRSAGHTVEVLERAAELTEVGAGLALWPNGVRVLAALGVSQALGAPVRGMQIHNWRGRLLTDTPISEFRARYGSELIIVHRAELHSALLEVLGRQHVSVAAEVTAFQQEGSTVSITMASGQRRDADLLVGADGLWSAVRRSLLGDGEPRYSGATCWRGVAPHEVADGIAVNWWGSGGEFGVFPLGVGRAYWFGVLNRRAGEPDGDGGRRDDVLRAFQSWPEPVAAVVRATPDTEVLRNDLYDRPPARTWTRGRVTLLGDAAHPMLPNAAQGACQALEDAAALSVALAAQPPEQALVEYEASRLRRANRLVRLSRQTARAVQSTNLVVVALRNLAVARAPRSMMLRQLDASLLES